MKLVVAIVQDYDAARILQVLLDHEFRVTQISTTGGFLRAGNTTFLIGVRELRVRMLLELIEANCKQRSELYLPGGPVDYEEWTPPEEIFVKVGGATLFILNVDRFERF